MCASVLQGKANKNTTNNTNNAPTFLKSNYKYKRRCRKMCFCVKKQRSLRKNLLQLATRVHQSGNDRYCANAKNTHNNKQIINLNKSENANTNANANYNKNKSVYNQIKCEITLILRLFILFVVDKVMRWRRNDDVIGNVCECRGSVEMQQQRRNYDKLSATTTTSTSTSMSTTASTTTSTTAVMTTSHQLDDGSKSYDSYNSGSGSGWGCGSEGGSGGVANHLQHLLVCLQRASSIDRCRRVNVLSTLTALLFMTLAFSAPHVEAGACWRSSNSNGKCSEIYLRNSTKAECCKYPELFYTDRDVVDVEFFFATTAGNGLTCSPCIENCKNVQCGWNKKCVKRKGRPKCVCAPECGGAARRRRQRDQKKIFRGHQQHSEELRLSARVHHVMDRAEVEQAATSQEEQAELVAESKSPHDIRSLSSEITNINLGVAPHQMQSQNQRKMLQIMQSQQSQQKPQLHKREPKTSRLLITASNVEQSSSSDGSPTTTRRLQVLSNVRAPHGSNYDDDHDSESADTADADADADANADADADIDENAVTVNNDDAAAEAVAEADQRVDKPRTSRHRANKKSRRRHENEMQLEHMANGSSSGRASSNFNDNNNNSNNNNHNRSNILLRHKQQHVRRRLENAPNRIKMSADSDGDGDSDVDNTSSSKQQRQRQRKRKQHQSQHSHNHRSKKQKKLKDHNANNNNNNNNKNAHAHRLFTSAESSTSSFVAIAAAAPSSNVNGTLLTSSLSAEHRLFNRGSHHAKSPTTATMYAQHQQQQQQQRLQPIQQQHTTTAQSSEAFPSGAAAVHVSKSSVNSVDPTLLDGIYDNFNIYGFPNRQYELMFEHLHGAHPVCGTDGRTYNTECQLKKRACRIDNPTLAVAYRGHCRTTCSGVKCLNGLQCVEDHYTIPHCIACKIDCDDADDIAEDDEQLQRQQRRDVIDPSRAVCGVDGKTYKSVCDINRMICKIGRSIAVAYPGPCRADRVTCADINCGARHTCLVDLLTHEPRCVSCRYKCARKRRPSSLRFEEGKICGVNNRTYNSWCEMRKDSCNTGFFIDVKSAGVCH